MKMENHCVVSKLHSDFVYVDFRMCEQNTLSKLYGNLLQTSSLWHRAARGTTRSARDPSSHTPAGAPQDDNVFLAGGFAPCTPIRNCEHSCLTIIVQFDILFFHKQVCQQSNLHIICDMQVFLPRALSLHRLGFASYELVEAGVDGSCSRARDHYGALGGVVVA